MKRCSMPSVVLRNLPPLGLRGFALAPLLALTLVATPRAEAAEPFLWMIEGDQPAFLYGTIHLPDDRLRDLPEVVQHAFDALDVFYAEIPMTQGAQMKAMMGLMHDESLKEILPEDLYARCETIFSSKGLPIEMVDRFRIIAVAVQISLLDYVQDLMAGDALDMFLYETAESNGKEVSSLETVEEQIAAFTSFTREEEITLLRKTLDDLDAANDEDTNPMAELLEHYLEGDAEALMKKMFEQLDIESDVGKKFHDVLLVKRNVVMTDRMEEAMKARPDAVHFFAVGAAHFPGDIGILELLDERGYKVKRLTLKDAEQLEEMLATAAH